MNQSKGGKRFWRQGEPLVWASGSALAFTLLLTALLLVVVMVNGLGVFWPTALVQVELTDGTTILGERITSQRNRETEQVTVQYKTGNRELDPQRQDFHWIDETAIEQTTLPASAYVLERSENGNFFGFLQEITATNLDVPSDLPLPERFAASLVGVEERFNREMKPISNKLAALSAQLWSVDSNILKVQYRKRHAHDDEPAGVDTASKVAALDKRLEELRHQQEEIITRSDVLVAEQGRVEVDIRKGTALFKDAAGQDVTIVMADVVCVYQPNSMGLMQKIGHYVGKIGELLFDEPRESNTEGGLFPAIFGTVMLIFLMAICCFPLGVLAGVYLGEYAHDGFVVRLVRIAVNNLAGIPSIVYGIFGLGFFIYGVGDQLDQLLYPERVEAGISTFGTGGILWASLTLGLLTIPVVIVSTEESLRTIPRSLREGSLSLGATKFQTLWRVLLPMASPGIMTGFILAMARAAGEVAPLMITGVVKLAPDMPLDGSFPFFHLDRKFMHLGFHIYDIGFQSPNVEASLPMVYVTTLLLLLIVLLMSSLAIYLRNKMRKRFELRTI